jgi:hypothetical protein
MSLREYLDPGGRMLGRRLDQLALVLENLSTSLCGTIAQALGETVGGLVRDTTLRVLDELTGSLPAADPTPLRSYSGEDDGMSDERKDWAGIEEPDPYPAEVEDLPIPAAPPRLPTALATGLHAAAWWLRRWTGQGCVLSTVAVGLAATGIAYLGGPLVAAALHLVATGTHCTTLAHEIGMADSALDRYDPS